MDEQTKTYLEECLPEKETWIKELEDTAIENNIPIMDRVSIDFMLHLIKMHQPAKLLEIGTAIGYSALRMQDANPNSKIITIEKDEARYREALGNIAQLQKSGNITALLGDALEVIGE